MKFEQLLFLVAIDSKACSESVALKRLIGSECKSKPFLFERGRNCSCSHPSDPLRHFVGGFHLRRKSTRSTWPG